MDPVIKCNGSIRTWFLNHQGSGKMNQSLLGRLWEERELMKFLFFPETTPTSSCHPSSCPRAHSARTLWTALPSATACQSRNRPRLSVPRGHPAGKPKLPPRVSSTGQDANADRPKIRLLRRRKRRRKLVPASPFCPR